MIIVIEGEVSLVVEAVFSKDSLKVLRKIVSSFYYDVVLNEVKG